MTQENRRNLKDFIDYVSTASCHIENGGFNRNLLTAGIYFRHRQRVYDEVGKIVIYADTSKSACEFCLSMIPEVSKMAKEYEITECDIHLFADSVYAEHRDIDIADVSSKVSINETDSSTKKFSLYNVYNHIIDNYMDDYNLNDDVSAIIIMTNVDCFENHERFDRLEYFDDYSDKILFLLDNQMGRNIQELEDLLPEDSNLIAIAPNDYNN